MGKLIEEWLAEFPKEGTRKAYKKRMRNFLERTNMTEEKLAKLSVKQAKHLILIYQSAEKKKGSKNNAILSIITAVRSFFAFLEKPLKFRRGQLLKLQAAKGEHVFSNGDFGKMYNCGNSFDKALLAVGVSLGWESSAILEVERKQFEAFIKRAKAEGKDFYFFESERPKTGELRFGVLNPLALKALENYLEVSGDKVKDQLFPITKQGMNALLRRLAREANIVLVGRVRWHLLRKWLMNSLSKAGFNSFMIKLVMGKAISISDSTYLQTLRQQIEEKYPRAYKENLCILRYQTKNSSNEIEELRAEVKQLRMAMRGMLDVYGEEMLEKAIAKLGLKGDLIKKANLDDMIKLMAELGKQQA